MALDVPVVRVELAVVVSAATLVVLETLHHYLLHKVILVEILDPRVEATEVELVVEEQELLEPHLVANLEPVQEEMGYRLLMVQLIFHRVMELLVHHRVDGFPVVVAVGSGTAPPVTAVLGAVEAVTPVLV
jgi:hypothetical protein